jgi:hypothetical protein
MCLGAAFAQMSVSLMVATLLQRCRFAPLHPTTQLIPAACEDWESAGLQNLVPIAQVLRWLQLSGVVFMLYYCLHGGHPLSRRPGCSSQGLCSCCITVCTVGTRCPVVPPFSPLTACPPLQMT